MKQLITMLIALIAITAFRAGWDPPYAIAKDRATKDEAVAAVKAEWRNVKDVQFIAIGNTEEGQPWAQGIITLKNGEQKDITAYFFKVGNKWYARKKPGNVRKQKLEIGNKQGPTEYRITQIVGSIRRIIEYEDSKTKTGRIKYIKVLRTRKISETERRYSKWTHKAKVEVAYDIKMGKSRYTDDRRWEIGLRFNGDYWVGGIY